MSKTNTLITSTMRSDGRSIQQARHIGITSQLMLSPLKRGRWRPPSTGNTQGRPALYRCSPSQTKAGKLSRLTCNSLATNTAYSSLRGGGTTGQQATQGVGKGSQASEGGASGKSQEGEIEMSTARENDPDDPYGFDDDLSEDDVLCFRCDGAGEVPCHCGGDLCFCGRLKPENRPFA